MKRKPDEYFKVPPENIKRPGKGQVYLPNVGYVKQYDHIAQVIYYGVQIPTKLESMKLSLFELHIGNPVITNLKRENQIDEDIVSCIIYRIRLAPALESHVTIMELTGILSNSMIFIRRERERESGTKEHEILANCPLSFLPFSLIPLNDNNPGFVNYLGVYKDWERERAKFTDIIGKGWKTEPSVPSSRIVIPFHVVPDDKIFGHIDISPFRPLSWQLNGNLRLYVIMDGFYARDVD